MQTITIPWRAWYGDEDLDLAFPTSWSVQAYWPRGGEDIGQDGIRHAFDNPIGSPPIEEIARGAGSVALAVEDISRPAQLDRVMPVLMQRLERAGVDLDCVVAVMANGSHRAMLKEGMVKKLGPDAAGTFDVYNHFPYGNCTDLGMTPRGTPVRICSYIAEAEVKLGLGGITPHGSPGFGGGAKVITPGVAHIDTIASMHEPGRLGTGLGNPEVELRQEIEWIAREHVGLNAIINVVPNARRGVAGLFVGDLVKAHRAGVARARQVFATPMPPEPVDVAIINAYPKDTDFMQKGLAMNVLNSAQRPAVRDGGLIITISASPEGRGFHGLYSPGMRYDRRTARRGEPTYTKLVNGRAESWLFSPNVSKNDARMDALFNTWDGLMAALESRGWGAAPTVAVFPCAAIQMAAN